MVSIYVVGRANVGMYNVNVVKDGKAVTYASLLSREKITEFRNNPAQYEVKLCDTTIRF